MVLNNILNRRVMSVTTDADQTTVDEVIDVIEEETSRVMLKVAGTSESETLIHRAFKIARIRLPGLATGAIDVRDNVPLVPKELHCRFDTLKNSADISLVAGRIYLPPRIFKFKRLWLVSDIESTVVPWTDRDGS